MTLDQWKLLLILNFDTNKNQGLTLSERCEIHQIITGKINLEESSVTKRIDELYLKIKAQNYKPTFYKWFENKETAKLERQIDEHRITWNHLEQKY
ncbi:hypothetical protein [Chishuiella changwenlii]|uniref:hypothetical protein n=1 Tax=Chishuiella changwenlii TaxID=1434701 RepID=UPI002FDAFDD2